MYVEQPHSSERDVTEQDLTSPTQDKGLGQVGKKLLLLCSNFSIVRVGKFAFANLFVLFCQV